MTPLTAQAKREIARQEVRRQKRIATQEKQQAEGLRGLDPLVGVQPGTPVLHSLMGRAATPPAQRQPAPKAGRPSPLTPVSWDLDASQAAGTVHPSTRAVHLPQDSQGRPPATGKAERSRSRSSKKGGGKKDKGKGKAKGKSKDKGKGKDKGKAKGHWRISQLRSGKESRKGRGKKGAP